MLDLYVDPGRWGGGELNKNLYGEALPRAFYIPFFTKKVPPLTNVAPFTYLV